MPSECTIKIYTVSGSHVRTLSHSDLAGPVGQEKWDGNTSGGEHAASGVYLWRVESSADSKNGKLILIR
jgi:flagellar hook assembly protein FlgD